MTDLPRPLGLAILLALAAAPAAARAQGIRNSRHDLSAGNTGASIHATSEKATCVFCHTPHRALQQTLLWNHAPSARTGYTWATTSWPGGATGSGTKLPTGVAPGAKNSVQPSSMRCLACHDGSVALGAVNHASGGATGNIAMTGPATSIDGSGRLIDPTYSVGLGGDLTDNHPISIPYAGSTYYGQLSGVPTSLVDNGANHYWKISRSCDSPSGICTAATGNPLNGRLINLVADSAGGVGIECVTCHEPHNKYGLAFFARVDTQNQSALCRSCHNK